jgi:hypothetical protein
MDILIRLAFLILMIPIISEAARELAEDKKHGE